MMSRDKLLQLKKAARRKTAGMELPIQTMHALIDSNLEVLNQLEGGKSTQELRAELTWREQQIREGLDYLRTVATPHPDDYWQSIDPVKANFTIDMLCEMLRAKGPKWHRDWKAYRLRIAEEFDEQLPFAEGNP
jgi:hypothetical protein